MILMDSLIYLRFGSILDNSPVFCELANNQIDTPSDLREPASPIDFARASSQVSKGVCCLLEALPEFTLACSVSFLLSSTDVKLLFSPIHDCCSAEDVLTLSSPSNT